VGEWDTRRERIIRILSGGEPVSLDDLCQELEVLDRRVILEDLTHIAQSLRKSGRTLVMAPPTCARCGFVFKSLRKPRKPSRCPKCKSERITPPSFQII